MSQIRDQIIHELPGVAVKLIQDASQPEVVGRKTIGTFVLPFDTAKKFLSGKPVHRPNRARPLPDNPGSPPPGFWERAQAAIETFEEHPETAEDLEAIRARLQSGEDS